jgi:hypothetical protein
VNIPLRLTQTSGVVIKQANREIEKIKELALE